MFREHLRDELLCGILGHIFSFVREVQSLVSLDLHLLLTGSAVPTAHFLEPQPPYTVLVEDVAELAPAVRTPHVALSEFLDYILNVLWRLDLTVTQLDGTWCTTALTLDVLECGHAERVPRR